MSQLAPQAFIANAKAVVVLGRAITPEENSVLNAIRKAAAAASEGVSTVNADFETFTFTSFYSNLATAQAVASAAQGFNPPPTSATATEV
jgi:hypothetical protein